MAKTIFLADDSVTIRKVVELTFSETGFQVESVGTGPEAVKRFHESDADLVLADVPFGYELCRRIKRSAKPVPVILLVGTFEAFDTPRAQACGADGHLVKPFESRLLLEQVQGLLGSSHDEEFDPKLIDALARAIVEQLSAGKIEELAKQIIPDVAEKVVRERIRELESEEA